MILPNNKSIGLIVGSGRCGTRSFARLFNKQPMVYAEHEKVFSSYDLVKAYYINLATRLLGMLMFHNVNLAIESGYHYLNYAPAFIKNFNSKVLCLKREKKTTVLSLATRVGPKKYLSENKFVKKDDCSYYNRNGHYCVRREETFPKVNSIAEYYDKYYEAAERIYHRFPNNFRIIDSFTTLNNENEQLKALRFMNVPEPTVILGIGKDKARDWTTIPEAFNKWIQYQKK